MKTSQMIFLGLALFLAVQSSAASHLANCGLGSGTDVCGCSELVVKAAKPARAFKYADPYVIKEAVAARSAPVKQGCGSVNHAPQISGPSVTDLLRTNCPVAPRFRPVGDLCGCGKTITEVVPAYPGKPVCNVCAQKAKQCECGCADPQHFGPAPKRAAFSSLSSANAELNAFEDDGLSFDEQESIYNSQPVHAAPADPVSLSLAYSLALKTTKTVPEGSLAFGPKTTPIDGSIRKKTVNIPEEKLFTVERPVVELKISPKSSASSTYEQLLAQQEALEQQRLELEAEAEAGQAYDPSFISYSDLGYGPVAPNGNNFVSHVSNADPAAEDPADEIPCGPVGRPLPGYVGGNVIVRNEAVVEESDPDYYSEGSYEQGSYEQEEQYGKYSSEEQEPCTASSGLLARLRASARSQNGCGCGCGR